MKPPQLLIEAIAGSRAWHKATIITHHHAPSEYKCYCGFTGEASEYQDHLDASIAEAVWAAVKGLP